MKTLKLKCGHELDLTKPDCVESVESSGILTIGDKKFCTGNIVCPKCGDKTYVSTTMEAANENTSSGQ